MPAKHLLQKTRSPARLGAAYNRDLYRGCCHGCIYCDSRSECYRIDDFDRVRAKENAIPLLRQELAAKRQTGAVSPGAMGDCYNPFSVLSCKYQRAGPTPGARAGGNQPWRPCPPNTCCKRPAPPPGLARRTTATSNGAAA
ncbi:hypothetical protein ACTNAU_09800, partial [Bittarella sp. HCP28S3_D9]